MFFLIYARQGISYPASNETATQRVELQDKKKKKKREDYVRTRNGV